MKRNIPLLILIVMLFIRCSEKAIDTKTDIINETYPEEQVALENMVNEIFELAKNKEMDSLETFHLWGPKFTKFDDDPTNPGRQDAEMTKKLERGIADLDSFYVDVQQFKADVFGEVAITTFLADWIIKVGGEISSGKGRGTMVFVKVDGSWRITHEHFSPFNYTYTVGNN